MLLNKLFNTKNTIYWSIFRISDNVEVNNHESVEISQKESYHMSKKLVQVLEYLIAGKQDEAKDLLHQVFIEKARKIHEDIMSHDDMEEEGVMGGDEGDDFKHDVMGGHDKHLEGLSDEIDAEETMAEEESMDDMAGEMPGDDVDVEDDGLGEIPGAEFGDEEGSDMDDDMGGEMGDMGEIEDTIGDLEDALAELKAEFERLEGGEGGSDEVADDEAGNDMGDDEAGEEGSEDFGDDESGDEAAPGGEEAGEEEDMDESWLDEDWDELAEAIELQKVSVPTSGEVGSGTYSSADANAKAKSPLPASQTTRMGAKPIKIEDKPHTKFDRETAPTSKDMGLSNRRKTAETGMTKMSKEGNSPNAAINKTKSEFGADTVGKDSPLSKAPRK